MNLLQRFCSAVIDASDAFGASMQGVDVRTHRQNLYGHADGIVAARVAGCPPPAGVARHVAHPEMADSDAAPLAPFYAARTSDVPLYQTLAEDLEGEAREAREAQWRDFDDADRWSGT
jgi:hypothetical protein